MPVCRTCTQSKANYEMADGANGESHVCLDCSMGLPVRSEPERPFGSPKIPATFLPPPPRAAAYWPTAPLPPAPPRQALDARNTSSSEHTSPSQRSPALRCNRCNQPIEVTATTVRIAHANGKVAYQHAICSAKAMKLNPRRPNRRAICPRCARPPTPSDIEHVKNAEGLFEVWHRTCYQRAHPAPRPNGCAVCKQPVTVGDGVMAKGYKGLLHPECFRKIAETCLACGKVKAAGEGVVVKGHLGLIHVGCITTKSRLAALSTSEAPPAPNTICPACNHTVGRKATSVEVPGVGLRRFHKGGVSR